MAYRFQYLCLLRFVYYRLVQLHLKTGYNKIFSCCQDSWLREVNFTVNHIAPKILVRISFKCFNQKILYYLRCRAWLFTASRIWFLIAYNQIACIGIGPFVFFKKASLKLITYNTIILKILTNKFCTD